MVDRRLVNASAALGRHAIARGDAQRLQLCALLFASLPNAANSVWLETYFTYASELKVCYHWSTKMWLNIGFSTERLPSELCNPKEETSFQGITMKVFVINVKEDRIPRWYFGGISATAAACVTHPMDLIKVQMQTQRGTKHVSFATLIQGILKKQGVRGLYNGVSATMVRQLTYSVSRFSIYEICKQELTSRDRLHLPFTVLVCLAAFGGLIGGMLGTPGDLVNVRMQNDVKFPPEHRRNYKNVLHGMYSILKKEGIRRLWTGGTTNCTRAVLMTIGQLSFYDKFKRDLLKTPYFVDNVATHVTASVLAGAVATTMTQPVDVIKTRVMNAKPGEVTNLLTLITATAKESPLAFYKGYAPAFFRLGPTTILTFVIYEQLRMNFGFDNPRTKNND